MKSLKLIIFFILLIFSMVGCLDKTGIENENNDEIITQKNSSLTDLKDKIEKDGKLFGVAYLGWIEGEFEVARAKLLEMNYIKDFTFISDIDKTTENEGYRVYLIVPIDGASLVICKCDFDEEYMPGAGEELLVSDQPVLIRGNMSDTIPNLYIVAQKGFEKVEYTPVQSGMDGKLENSENKVYDFTPYDIMPEFYSVDKAGL